MRTRFYKDMVFYQIWPRSFKDGNGDGMGDLYGVYEKLDYIKSLNVDGIWFSPLYCSPGADCGYDVSDYYNIDPMFGNLDIFKKVLDKAHEMGLKIIMDLVVNHTSDEHEWFQKSRQKIEPYTDYYIWRPAKVTKKGKTKLPNNWDSNFEGKAWTWDEERKEYYLHLFAIKQPDLNMDNPLVREEVKKIMRFWLDLGVDGFREDVITYISKPAGLPDEKLVPFMRGILKYNHGPNIHKYLQEFYDDVLSKYDCVTIAEAPLIKPKRALEYIKETDNNEIDMMIQFECMCADCLFTDYLPTKFHLRKMKKAFSSWQYKLNDKAWNMLYLENHDHPRIINRYGSTKYPIESGKMLAVSYLFQMGTPFIYMGQEIGMQNFKPTSIEDYEDVQTLNQSKNKSTKKRLKIYERSSRDNARTPFQWDMSEYCGFSDVKPWFHVNEQNKHNNVLIQENNNNSLLNFYRKAIKLRKELDVVKNGKYKEIKKFSNKIYSYSRINNEHKLLVICSFTEHKAKYKAPKAFDLTKGKLILSNYDLNEIYNNSFVTRPYEVRVYYY